MKIAILTSVFFQKVKEVHGYDRIIYGGAERYLVELCLHLQKQGHEVTVYQAYESSEECNGMLSKEYRGIHVICLPTKDTWDYHTAPNLNILFYELSLSADLRIYFASFLAFPLVKNPSISINHGIFWDYAGGLLTNYNTEQKNEFFRRQLFGMTEPNLCVAVDTNVRNMVASLANGQERKIKYIPNFADTSEFNPRVEAKDWEGVRVLFPRRLAQLRGINEFLCSAQELPQYKFLMCGQSFDETANEQFEQQKSFGAPNVELTMRPMEEMSLIYKETDIAVIPTRASEGTSLSCLEAMASGVPVVTTVAGGLPNLVFDQYNGLVVDLNHDSLTKAIAKLAENEDLRYKFAQRNVQIIKDSFSKEIWLDRWSEVLNTLK